VLHPAHPVTLIFGPAQTFHYLEQRKRQSACLTLQGRHADPSTEADRQQEESQMGSLSPQRGEAFAASVFPPPVFKLPQTHCKANTDNIATRGWAGKVTLAKGWTHRSRIAWRQTATRSWSSASLFVLQAVSEAWRCLQTRSCCPCATAQLFQGDGELIRSLHCLPQTLSLLSSFSVDAPSVVF